MEKKYFIGLYGQKNIGRTRTLRMLIDLLQGVPISYSSDDAQVVCKYRGRTIVVATAGDNKNEAIDNILYARKYSWDIAITSTQTKEITNNNARGYIIRIVTELIWKEKYKGEDVDNVNLQCAMGLKINIDALIDELDGEIKQNFFAEPNPSCNGKYMVTYKKPYKSGYIGEYEISPIKKEDFNTEKEAQDCAKKMNKKLPSVKKFTYKCGDDGFYYIHQWNEKELEYDNKPINNIGYSIAEAKMVAEYMNAQETPILY